MPGIYNGVNRWPNPRCGEIWMCNLEDRNGSIQRGYRPVYVLSNNINNSSSPTLNIIPLTSRMNKRKLPVHVELWDYSKFGLKAPSVMMVEQVMTITADALSKRIGVIEDVDTIRKIRDALIIQFPIMNINGLIAM